ncbi:MAG: hypothetical protein ACRD3G_08910 [Vicinamibacterales bacterium]
MTDDEQILNDINVAIGEAEERGDREALAKVLAPRLAFQRADASQTVDDQVAFLQKVTAGNARVTKIIEPIEVHGHRAIVKCVVDHRRRTGVPQYPSLCPTGRRVEASRVGE